MQFKQFYLGCLAHASYYIGSGSEAAIIDPQRDVQQYLDEAEANGQRIKYVIETHSHADFVSGHLELAGKTGGQIIYGQRAATQFPTLKVKDGDELNVGAVKLGFLETPGHTPEGITIVAQGTDDPSAPLKMFTGDTLFIGDVGRPDLIGSKGFTAEQMGEMLYESLHEKILKYPDETEVYPAHGAGSLCGKSLSKETWSTLGNQRQFNYALQAMSKAEFVKLVTADQPEVPMYFPKSAAKNLEGSRGLDQIAPPRELTTETILKFDGVVLDVRPNAVYGKGHVPNAVNIGLGGQFASWAGTMIAIGTNIAVFADTKDQVDEAAIRLARVGHDLVTGYMLSANYTGKRMTIEQLLVNEANERLRQGGEMQFIDVRRPGEHSAGHARGAANFPLNRLTDDLEKLDPSRPTYVICQGGYRSSLAASILENAGFTDLHNITGGTAAWIAAGLETEAAASASATT
jgi:glyoxylase-like metal-dependent hydrolase (beta-lactamase superfamily II)/rhodanese-related sulfurtransferase